MRDDDPIIAFVNWTPEQVPQSPTLDLNLTKFTKHDAMKVEMQAIKLALISIAYRVSSKSI